MSLWVFVTLLAAAAQTTRFVLQKRLGQGGLSATGATFARFLYAAPLAFLAALVTSRVLGVPVPVMGARFWGFVAVGGLAQIVATELTVRLFALRNFAVGVAFTKTEVAGVIAMARAGGQVAGRVVWMGLAAGALFGVAATGYRGAALALEPAPFFLRATVALAAATALQTVAMALWMAMCDPGALARVLRGWRVTAPVGLMGMLGSLGWFTAFSLQSAAYVRALGQVELLFTLLASMVIFRERPRLRELAGIALIGVSVLVLVIAA